MTQPRAILGAHGCGDASQANALVRDLAARLDESIAFDVSCAFNLGTPGFAEAAARGEAVFVPLLLAEGWFATRRMPEVLAETGPVGRWRIAPAVGASPALHRLIVDRIVEAATGTEHTAVLIVGHGTRRHAASGATAESIADAVSDRLPGTPTACGFIDQEPGIAEAVRALDARRIVVLPFMLGGGGHELEDLPDALGIPRGSSEGTDPESRQIELLPPVGRLDGFRRIVRDVLDEAVARPALRLGTRASELALIQTNMAAEALARVGVHSERVECTTSGDEDLTTPIERFASGTVFTDGLDRALAAGEIDLAVHSLKDLPLELPAGLAVAAVLPRGSSGEAVVARDGLRLADLPPGSVVGTSSPRRRAQVLAERPDLSCAPIRGPVPARVEQVDQGRFDATVLAIAGLERLGLLDRITDHLPADRFCPQAGQGAIALVCRADDWYARTLAERVNDRRTREAVNAELAIVRAAEANGERLAAALVEPTETGSWTARVQLFEHDRLVETRAAEAGSIPELVDTLGISRTARAEAGSPA